MGILQLFIKYYKTCDTEMIEGFLFHVPDRKYTVKFYSSLVTQTATPAKSSSTVTPPLTPPPEPPEPSEPPEPIEPTKPTQPTQPTKSSKPTEPTKPEPPTPTQLPTTSQKTTTFIPEGTDFVGKKPFLSSIKFP